MVHTNTINVFISILSAGSLARIEGILDELVQDIKTGKKEPSVSKYISKIIVPLPLNLMRFAPNFAPGSFLYEV